MTPNTRRLDVLRDAARTQAPVVASLAARIAVIPSPTGYEKERAAFVASLLRDRGYSAEVDEIGNVTARRGSRGGRALMLAAHTDTVFPAGTPLDVSVDGDRMAGPGLGDNSLGVAAVVGLLDALDRCNIETDSDIIAVATVGEEGLGNLVGARRAVERMRADTAAFVAVEGHNLGRVTCVAVGSQRWRITVSGPGGHSWGAFGQPSAIHGLARIVSLISELSVPTDPKTTFNVGTIEGGVSINTIAPSASALVDMRSTDPDALERLAGRVRAIASRPPASGLKCQIDVLGERPAGETCRTHTLVVAAADALRQVGIEPVFDASSTDANIPISKGIPAVCIGVSRGGQGHTVDEFIEVPPIELGLAQLLLLTVDATAAIAAGRL